ncbi:MAG: UDP-2,3-diacylglucosamine diphosphatase [Proteobacteria bacterium]|nr:UDP-2,3-diacylglucosamine diphosphatase [Pseudomonadota bacterium]
MKKQPASSTIDYYPIIVISDLHIGKKYGASDMLCEFLHNTRCDKLVLNGDIIDGRLINHRRPRDLPESQKRVLDAINRKIAEGTEVIYLPGNHDIELRDMGIAGKTILGMKVEQSLDLVDNSGRKFLVLHGDQFDLGEEKAQRLPQWFLTVVERADETMTSICTVFDKVAQRTLGKSFRLAQRVRGLMSDDKHGHPQVEKTAINYAKEKGYNGIICGHLHQAANRTKDGILYLNSGDWVDSFSAIVMDQQGSWDVLQWSKHRKEKGLKKRFFHAANDNPDKSFRPMTEKLIDAIKTVWPGKGAKKSPPSPPQP